MTPHRIRLRYRAPVFTLKDFRAALRGDDSELVRAAGPDGVVRVSPELSCVLVAPGGDGRLRLGDLRDPEHPRIDTIPLPPGFRVREISVEGERFVLTDADGRTARGTPDQFTAQPKIIRPDCNPRHDEQSEELFLAVHERSTRRRTTTPEPASADLGLSEPHVAAVAAAGQVHVPVAGEQVWVSFDCAGPEKVVALLPHARELLASFEELGREAAEFLQTPDEDDEDYDEEEDGGEDEEDDRDPMVPTSLVIYLTGDFELHFEAASGTYCLDGYWPSVQFTADRTLVGGTVEA